MLALVAQRATASDYERLERMASTPGGEEDLVFHEALWRLAGNRFVWGLRGLLLRFLVGHPERRARTASHRVVREHRLILRALRAGDLEGAILAMHDHLGVPPGRSRAGR
jgi:DNA-binding FadR family transcriptional regulator